MSILVHAKAKLLLADVLSGQSDLLRQWARARLYAADRGEQAEADLADLLGFATRAKLRRAPAPMPPPHSADV